jgi:hypothetical protein
MLVRRLFIIFCVYMDIPSCLVAFLFILLTVVMVQSMFYLTPFILSLFRLSQYLLYTNVHSTSIREVQVLSGGQ